MNSPSLNPFIDRSQVRWNDVKQVQHTLVQHFRYDYPGPIEDLTHRLMIAPRSVYGDQQRCDFHLNVRPDLNVKCKHDLFGNEVLSVKARRLESPLVFEMSSTVRRNAEDVPIYVSKDEADHFLSPTRLTFADEHLSGIAHVLEVTAQSDLAFAQAASDWVSKAMKYGFGLTDTSTAAAEALTIGKGLCQDYAHIMIALCREAGVAARYVSGHMLGEGGSHAWVEVLIPEGERLRAYAFDPTNRRRPNMSYITVAVGRDYRDVAPTSGSFSAPYLGKLTATKRAGLTLVEYEGGEVVLG